ncbi:XdhC family protein [Telmatospirillum sp.]|uniref:XdhC family protein n=1 Tax=Telmatospirillum sp. TaxID=2079197 RepID=UPI002850679E|nr:XdhC family protein [Telmatospirillum sp.]MDR3437775.1 XdhC family protein [Telmatospirillum sp.]
MTPALFAKLQALRAERRPVAVVTNLANGHQCLALSTGGTDGSELVLTDEIRDQVGAMLTAGSSGQIESETGTLFVRSYTPPWSLAIVGAVHITQFLAPMARLAGFDVTVIDPRRAFATDQRFPDVAMITGWPDEIMARTPPGPQTAVVTLTHDPKIDDPALIAALRSDAFYIGALGSSRTHAQRVARLVEHGLSETQVARVAAPVGLDLGGRMPAEIAISVLAEVVATRHGKPRTSR